MTPPNKPRWTEDQAASSPDVSTQLDSTAQKVWDIITIGTLDYEIIELLEISGQKFVKVSDDRWEETYLIYKRWEFRDFIQEGHPMSVYEISDIWEVRTSLTKLEEFHSHDNWKIIKKPVIKKRPLYNDWANVHTGNPDVIERWGYTFARKEDGTYLISRGAGFRDFTVGASIATVYEISEDWKQVKTEKKSKDFHSHKNGDITIIKKMKPVEKK